MHAAAKMDSAHIFFAALWWLWVRRNHEVLGLVTWTDLEVLQRINQLADVCRETFNDKGNVISQARMVGWKRPPPGSIKIKC